MNIAWNFTAVVLGALTHAHMLKYRFTIAWYLCGVNKSVSYYSWVTFCWLRMLYITKSVLLCKTTYIQLNTCSYYTLSASWDRVTTQLPDSPCPPVLCYLPPILSCTQSSHVHPSISSLACHRFPAFTILTDVLPAHSSFLLFTAPTVFGQLYNRSSSMLWSFSILLYSFRNNIQHCPHIFLRIFL